jgi:hypothetical protein
VLVLGLGLANQAATLGRRTAASSIFWRTSTGSYRNLVSVRLGLGFGFGFGLG